MEHGAAAVAPAFVNNGMAAAQQAADVIVAPNVEDQILRPMACPFLSNHPAVSLIDAVPAHAEVPNRLAEMPGQILLPGFPVIDLIAVRKAIAVCVYAGISVRIKE